MDLTSLQRADEGLAATLTEACLADLTRTNDTGTCGLAVFTQLATAQEHLIACLVEGSTATGPGRAAERNLRGPSPSQDPQTYGEELAREYRRAARRVEHAFTQAEKNPDRRAADIKHLLTRHTGAVSRASQRLEVILGLS